MNETLGSLRTWLADVYGDESTEALPFFDRIINDGIRASTLGHRFDALTNEKTITVASGALTLPPLFQKMNFICEDISLGYRKGSFFRQGQRADGGGTRVMSRWYMPDAIKKTSGTTYKGDITKGSSVILRDKRVAGNDWYDADDVGEMLVIEGQQAVYEVIAVDTTTDFETVTVYPSVSADSASSVNIEVDPMGQRQYTLYTEADALYTGDITIGYQEVHPTLINENDRLLIDCSESVRVYAMTIAYRQGKYDVTADRLNIDLERAYRLETANDSAVPETILPRSFGNASLFEV